jgi:hypothetical protein
VTRKETQRVGESNFPELNSKWSESALLLLYISRFFYQAGHYSHAAKIRISRNANSHLTRARARAFARWSSRLRNPRAPACVTSHMSNASSNACIVPRWVFFEENVYLSSHADSRHCVSGHIELDSEQMLASVLARYQAELDSMRSAAWILTLSHKIANSLVRRETQLAYIYTRAITKRLSVWVNATERSRRYRTLLYGRTAFTCSVRIRAFNRRARLETFRGADFQIAGGEGRKADLVSGRSYAKPRL